MPVTSTITKLIASRIFSTLFYLLLVVGSSFIIQSNFDIYCCHCFTFTTVRIDGIPQIKQPPQQDRYHCNWQRQGLSQNQYNTFQKVQLRKMDETTRSTIRNSQSVTADDDVAEVLSTDKDQSVQLQKVEDDEVPQQSRKRIKLMPTMRNFTTSTKPTTSGTTTTTGTTTTEISSSSSSFQHQRENAMRDIQEYTSSMLERYKNMIPFTSMEIQIIIQSLQNVIPLHNVNDDNNNNTNDDDNHCMTTMLQVVAETILPQYAHVSHKNWTQTGQNAEQWRPYLFPSSSSSSSTIIPTTDGTTNEIPLHYDRQQQQQQRHMFERIYREGNWDGAVTHSQQLCEIVNDDKNIKNNNKPWAVLVTGVNGIRKTTSIYQEWFPLVLQEAIQSPNKTKNVNDEGTLDMSNLPCGSNTFFRQLDHMIATLCNEEFIRLYTYTRDMMLAMDDVNDDNETIQKQQPTPDIIQLYSNMKAAIFSRYRTISELLGVILLREAQRIPINCMLETSGRDVAMFHYIDHFFSADTYNKLALHFTINDLQYAKTSVDQRMVDEIQSGIVALNQNSIFDIINTNIGGPYGSEVLSEIQADSDRVWEENVMVDDGNNATVGQNWYKATIQINAHPSEPWTAQAVKPDGTLGTIYPFQRK